MIRRVPVIRNLFHIKFFPPRRGWEAARHPAGRLPVATGDRPVDRPSGFGVLRLRTGYRRQIRPLNSAPGRTGSRFDVARALTPVCLVDGRPVATGWGEVRIAVPAGARFIEVQAGESRAYRVVTVADGRTVSLDHAATVNPRGQLFDGSNTRDYSDTGLAPRGRLLIAAQYGMRWTILTMMLCLVVMLAAAAFEPPSAVAWSLVVGTVAVLIAVAVWRYRLLRRHSRLEPTALPTAAGEAAPTVLDPEDESPPCPPSGHGAVVIHPLFTLERYSREQLQTLTTRDNGSRLGSALTAAVLGEPEPPRVRPWIAVPELRIDGRQVPCAWARLWYPLSPGEHDIELRVPPPPGELVGPNTTVDLAERRAMLRQTVTVTAGATTVLNCRATISARPEPDSGYLASYGALLSEYRD